MKNLLSLLFVLLLSNAHAQERTCFTPAMVAPVIASLDADPLNGDYCVTAYIEVDHDIVVERGGVGPASAFIDGLLSEVAALYEADGISLNFITYYWETESPYTETTSGGLLNQFRQYRTLNAAHGGDVAMLLSYKASGGIAYVDVICGEIFGYSFSSIRNTYERYPAYSWSVEVIAHELGHNLGSGHTHACIWNGNNTAIDDLSPFGTEGGCDALPRPTNGATVMSYGHLVPEVGINFLNGFGPQPLAVIKNRIAAANCVECEDGPDEPDTCSGNQIIVELQLDNYPHETRWELTTGEGEIVGASEPYPKNQMNTYHANTFCLPDGCYTFTMYDVDGLAGYGCSEGMYVVNGEAGEIASGQSFEVSETTGFCFSVAPPNGDCENIALRADSLTDYANQSRYPFVTVTDIEGQGVTVDGNNWRALSRTYTLTPFSELIFDATNLNTGEIQGVSLLSNVFGICPNRSFRFAGTQNWGIPVEQVAEGETKTITIPIGQYFTGDVTHIVLINDDDVRGLVHTSWQNMRICESDPETLSINKAALPQAQGKDSDEDWDMTESQMQEWIKRRIKNNYRKPFPNPVSNILTITRSKYQMLNTLGQVVRSGEGDKINMAGLPQGAYSLVSSQGSQTIIKY